jgi:hypothetical protein
LCSDKDVDLSSGHNRPHVYVSCDSASEHTKGHLAELQGAIKLTIEVGDFNSPLSVINEISRQELNQELEDVHSVSTHLTEMTCGEHPTQQQ